MSDDKKDQSPATPLVEDVKKGLDGAGGLRTTYIQDSVHGAGDLRTRQGGSGDTSDKSKSGGGSDDKK